MSVPLPAAETQRLLDRARGGDRGALELLLAGHRDYIKRVVELRMDGRLRGRLDPSDVVQEALLDAARGFASYAERTPIAFHLWLRQAACDRLSLARRRHLATECRDASREVMLPEHSSALLARALGRGRADTPLGGLVEQELAQSVRQALARLAEPDAEIILLRNLEELSNQEAAEALGIAPAAASKRYARALIRLERLLRESFPDTSL